MNVDLLSLLNNQEQKVEIKGNVSFVENDVDAKCEVDGIISSFAGRIELEADANAVLNTKCARCLKPLTVPVNVHISEVVGEEGVELNGSVLELDDIIKNNILVELPIRFLCNEDCKGICSICGTDLNVSECHCKTEVFDERFAVLKSLLEDGNEPK